MENSMTEKFTHEQLSHWREYAGCHSNPLSQSDAMRLFDHIAELEQELSARDEKIAELEDRFASKAREYHKEAHFSFRGTFEQCTWGTCPMDRALLESKAIVPDPRDEKIATLSKYILDMKDRGYQCGPDT